MGCFFFYQVRDGQMLFLHPLCSKILLSEFGSYDTVPLSLEGTILELEELTQTEKTRKRYKALSHLPLTSIFQFVEIDLSEIASPKTLKIFSEDLKRRQQRREKLLLELKRKLRQKEREETELQELSKRREQERLRDTQKLKNFNQRESIKEVSDFSVSSASSSGAPEASLQPSLHEQSFSTPAASQLKADQVSTEQRCEKVPSAKSFADMLKAPKKDILPFTEVKVQKSGKKQYVLLSNCGGRGYL